MDKTIYQKISGLFRQSRFSAHHKSHAASAFYPSLFQNQPFLVMDGLVNGHYQCGNTKKENLKTRFYSIPHSNIGYSALLIIQI